MGLPPVTITTPSLMKYMESDLSKKVIVLPVIADPVDKIIFTQQDMDKLYDLAVQYKNGDMTMEELLCNLRGGEIKEVVAAFGIVMAIITVLNNVDFKDVVTYIVGKTPTTLNFISGTGSKGVCHPSGTRINQGKFDPTRSQKVGGRIRVRMAASNQCPSNQMQVSSFRFQNGRMNLHAAYQEVQRRAQAIGNKNFHCSFQRFQALAQEGTQISEITVREAISALQGEMLGYYKDTVRGNFGVAGPDFKVVGLGKFSHITHLEIKNPVGSAIEKASRNTSDLLLQGENIGRKIVRQQKNWSTPSYYQDKQKFPHINLNESFPKSPNNMLGVVDTFDVPKFEKTIIADSIKNQLVNPSYVFMNIKKNI